MDSESITSWTCCVLRVYWAIVLLWKEHQMQHYLWLWTLIQILMHPKLKLLENSASLELKFQACPSKKKMTASVVSGKEICLNSRTVNLDHPQSNQVMFGPNLTAIFWNASIWTAFCLFPFTLCNIFIGLWMWRQSLIQSLSLFYDPTWRIKRTFDINWHFYSLSPPAPCTLL